MKKRSTLNPKDFEIIASRFRALGEVSRLKIVHALHDQERNVGQLVAITKLSQPNVSRHLLTLYRDGIVSKQKRGLEVFYAISDPQILKICAAVCNSLLKDM